MRVVVVGSSAAGQFAALLLARAGHDVQLLDRDELAVAPDVGTAAATAFRSSAPQIVQPHALLPGARLLLRRHLPDVYAALIDAGALESTLAMTAPPWLDLEPQAGDEDYTWIATRRSTLDLVLRRAVTEQQGITRCFGVKVTGLLADRGVPPRVRGVRVQGGDVDADLVVDASGRRTHLDRWLADIGTALTELSEAECGLCYQSRHYRVRAGQELPGHPATRILLGLDEFTTGLWNCDNGTATIAVAPLTQDDRFRPVRIAAVFDAVVRTVPAFQPWLDALEPVSDVFVMAGLHNTYRRLVLSDAPVATGLALVGDSRCTTNPTFGRGLPLALLEAADLVAGLRGCGDDPLALAHVLEEAAREHVEPFYVDQARNDASRLAALEHVIFGTPPLDDESRPEAVTFSELRRVMLLDGDVFRAFGRVMGMLAQPDAVYSDPLVVRRVRQLLAEGREAPEMPQPTRADLEAALASGSAPTPP